MKLRVNLVFLTKFVFQNVGNDLYRQYESCRKCGFPGQSSESCGLEPLVSNGAKSLIEFLAHFTCYLMRSACFHEI